MAYIPDGFHSIIPFIVVRDGAAAISLYKKALGAKEVSRFTAPGSKKIMHACIEIGDSKVFLTDENRKMGMLAPKKNEVGTRFYVYVKNVDALHKKAVKAGLTEIAAPEDMFWGDRTAVLTDPDGHRWTLATHIREVSEKEMAEAMSAMAKS